MREVKFRFKIITTELAGDVTCVNISKLSKNNKNDETISKTINLCGTTTLEINVSEEIETIIVEFQENPITRTCVINCCGYGYDQNRGFLFTEIPDPNDVTTYMGGYAYKHPIFTYSPVDYNSIVVGAEKSDNDYIQQLLNS